MCVWVFGCVCGCVGGGGGVDKWCGTVLQVLGWGCFSFDPFFIQSTLIMIYGGLQDRYKVASKRDCNVVRYLLSSYVNTGGEKLNKNILSKCHYIAVLFSLC